MSRWARTVAALLTGTVLLSGVVLVFRYSWFREVVRAADPDPDLVPVAGSLLVLIGLAWALCGLVVVWRTGNVVGWISILIGVCFGLNWIGSAIWSLERAGQTTTSPARVVGALMEFSWFPAIVLMTVMLPLLFPTGRLTSPRWRWVGVVGGIALLGANLYIAMTLVTGTYVDSWEDDSESSLLLFLPLLVGVGGSVASMSSRFRNSGSVERQQIKLVMVSLVVVCTIFFLLFLDLPAMLFGPDFGPLITLGSFALVPIAIVAAILRYKLYDIDRLISRTVSYALVVAVLVAIFIAVTVGVPQLLGLPDDSPSLVAVATLGAAGLFNPLRRRIQGIVDRRFNRARYDTQQEMDSLAERLRTELEIEDLTTELIEVVAKTMQPVTATVWIRGKGEASSWVAKAGT